MMARQISLRLNDEEEARLTEVCQRVSDRAGVRVDQTLVVKALIGFRQLRHLHEDDRRFMLIPPELEPRKAPARRPG